LPDASKSYHIDETIRSTHRPTLHSVHDLIFVTSMSRATRFSAPRGIITSAQCLLGSTNSRCIGLTVFIYWLMTESTEVRVREYLFESGESVVRLHLCQEIFDIHHIRNGLSTKIRIPSTMMISRGSTGVSPSTANVS